MSRQKQFRAETNEQVSFIILLLQQSLLHLHVKLIFCKFLVASKNLGIANNLQQETINSSYMCVQQCFFDSAAAIMLWFRSSRP